MKVCWLTNYPSPYKIKLFNELAKSIDLTVLMLGGKDSNRNNEWTINPNDKFKVILIDKNYNRTLKELAYSNDILIDSLYLSIYGICAVNLFKKQNKKVILQVDGGIAKNRGFVINKIMSVLMNKHDFVISSSEFTDKYLNYYGISSSKISNFRFTSLSLEDIVHNKELIKSKVNNRNKLGIDDKFTLISVGQPIKRKGFDILLNSYIQSGLTDKINLLIVGGEPQKEIVKIVNDNNLSNVRFIDLIDSNELKEYYSCVDAFILCTREDIWGLVIEEALSFGLPVITSDNCIAGLHFNKLSECVSICNVNDIDSYAKEIIKLYENKNKTNELSNKCIETIKEYSIENSANDIVDILNGL